jgi:hypothetical protein
MLNRRPVAAESSITDSLRAYSGSIGVALTGRQLSRLIPVTPQAGGVLVTQHLAQLIFVQTMRARMESQQASLFGWLGALTDLRMSKALNCMYEKPGHKWALEALGRLVGMSCAAFARRSPS